MKKNPSLEASSLQAPTLLLLLLTFLLFTGYRSCVRTSGLHTTGSIWPRPAPQPPSGGSGIATLPLSQAPRHVRRVIDHLKQVKHLRPPRGFQGGRLFRNREGMLPKGRTWYEFDVHPLQPGVSRGGERLVVDRSKQFFYYTRDHYRTFVRVE